jgi:hypothetical protein
VGSGRSVSYCRSTARPSDMFFPASSASSHTLRSYANVVKSQPSQLLSPPRSAVEGSPSVRFASLASVVLFHVDPPPHKKSVLPHSNPTPVTSLGPIQPCAPFKIHLGIVVHGVQKWSCRNLLGDPLQRKIFLATSGSSSTLLKSHRHHTSGRLSLTSVREKVSVPMPGYSSLQRR